MTTRWRRAWRLSPPPPSHGGDSDNWDLSDGRSRGEGAAFPPFFELYNGVESYDAAAGGDNKWVEDGLRAAGIDAALRLVLRQGR